jgi:hypothetical protein
MTEQIIEQEEPVNNEPDFSQFTKIKLNKPFKRPENYAPIDWDKKYTPEWMLKLQEAK